MIKLFFISIVFFFPFLAEAQNKDKYFIKTFGASDKSFELSPNQKIVPFDSAKKYDVVIVGGGLGGLSAAHFLTAAKKPKSVLLLEKEPELGGLAAGKQLENGVTFDRGAAYWTNAYEEEKKILASIGLEKFEKYKIHEPIDSYLWKEKMYLGMWELESTMDALPQSFRLFQNEVAYQSSKDLIANQPMEEADPELLSLDDFTAAEWIKKIPSVIKKRAELDDEEGKRARKVYDQFVNDPKVQSQDGMNGMRDVVEFLDLYTRSALGTLTEGVSALAFLNFYSSEIEPRYTTPRGTGIATLKMTELLAKKPKYLTHKLSTTVTKITHTNDPKCLVKTEFVNKDGLFYACSDYSVFAAQMKFAPKIIQGLVKDDPKKVAAISRLGYSHYSVHAVFTEGHPFRDTYDTWVRASDYKPDSFTDLILGRWMDPKINGFEKWRENIVENGKKTYHEKDVVVDGETDTNGIMSIYQPLPETYLKMNYDAELAKKIATAATDDMIRYFEPLSAEKIKVKYIETNNWPFSVHIARKGFFKTDAKLLRKSYGRIVFAHSNIGTPAFEEALFRGHCAAVNILLATDSKYKKPSWSNCPKEILTN